MVKVYSGKPNRVTKISHRMPRKIAAKYPMTCKDGPYVGQVLFLTEPSTCVFSVGGFKGRYINGYWEDM